MCDLNTVTLLDPYRYKEAVLMDENKEEQAIAELSRVTSPSCRTCSCSTTSAPRSSTPWATTPALCGTARSRCAWTRRTATHWSSTARRPPRPSRNRSRAS